MFSPPRFRYRHLLNRIAGVLEIVAVERDVGQA
jgi:hypothetical protein